MIDGRTYLFSTTLYDGALTSWGLDGTGLTQIDSHEYAGGLRAGGTASIMQVDVDGATTVMTGGGRNWGGLQTHSLTGSGHFGGADWLHWNATPFSSLAYGQTVMQADGNQIIYGVLAETDGIGRLTIAPDGHVIAGTLLSLDGDAGVTAMATIEVAGTDYVLAASGTQNTVTVWGVSDTGDLHQADMIGTEDGLWVAAPTAMEIATTGGQTYVILAAAGSGSLSVMTLDAAGRLDVTDHVLDSRNSRFDDVSAIAVVEHGGQVYVIAGGSDGGISLFLLREDGTLLARGHLADTTQMGLENISAIDAVSVGDGIDIFVASSQVAGITLVHFDAGPAGQTMTGTGVLTGTAGVDVITGAAGADTLAGGAGDDVLTDGAGADRLTGGAGADTFILAYDTNVDLIMDFDVGIDQIDLSAWPGLRSTAQLTMTSRSDGIRIAYGDDVLIVRSADGQPIDPASFGATDLIGDARVPQNIVPGYAGPATDIPDLPDRPDYTPYVYTPVPVDPNPAQPVITPTPDRTDTNTITPAPGEPDFPVQNTGPVITGTDTSETLSVTNTQPIVYGMGGNDRLNGSDAVNTLYGGSGNDRLYGEGGNDRLIGGSGADRIIGGWGGDFLKGSGGNDILRGGGGTDVMKGNNGDDRMWGGGKADRISGGTGHDSLHGGAGHDKLRGGSGDDKLEGKSGRDLLKGGTGHDRMWGGSGADKMHGDNGHDTLFGGAGRDQLSGGKKNDVLMGGSSADRMWGGGGRDTLNGQRGDDVMTGGSGADTFIFTDGADRITDFSTRADRLHLDDGMWRGNLSVDEVVDRYATVQGGNVVFDFGGGDTLTLTDVTNLNALSDTISIV